jgi:hypothetical protein
VSSALYTTCEEQQLASYKEEDLASYKEDSICVFFFFFFLSFREGTQKKMNCLVAHTGLQAVGFRSWSPSVAA